MFDLLLLDVVVVSPLRAGDEDDRPPLDEADLLLLCKVGVVDDLSVKATTSLGLETGFNRLFWRLLLFVVMGVVTECTMLKLNLFWPTRLSGLDWLKDSLPTAWPSLSPPSGTAATCWVWEVGGGVLLDLPKARFTGTPVLCRTSVRSVSSLKRQFRNWRTRSFKVTWHSLHSIHLHRREHMFRHFQDF